VVFSQGEKGAQILVDPELVNFLETSLIQVRSIAVQTTAIPLTALQVKPPRVDSFRSVEASLRVDALASAGFRMSRSKLADMIRSAAHILQLLSKYSLHCLPHFALQIPQQDWEYHIKSSNASKLCNEFVMTCDIIDRKHAM
jgi:hypothetical protein